MMVYWTNTNGSIGVQEKKEIIRKGKARLIQVLFCLVTGSNIFFNIVIKYYGLKLYLNQFDLEIKHFSPLGIKMPVINIGIMSV